MWKAFTLSFLFILVVGVKWAVAENDPVPIIDESYFDRHDRPAAKFFSQFEQPEEQAPFFPELSTPLNSRPQLRSLDGNGGLGDDWQNGFHESSRTRKTFKRRTSRKNIAVRNGGGDVVSNVPHFSEEVTYRRSNNADKNNAEEVRSSSSSQLRSLDSQQVHRQSGQSSRSNGCVTNRCRVYSSSTDTNRQQAAVQLRSLNNDDEESQLRSGRSESEGLRLYNKLIEEGRTRRRNGGVSRNQLRSLDTSSSASSHDTQHVQLQSGVPIPSEVMSSAGLHSGEMYYRRSSSSGRGQRRQNGQSSASTRTRSLSSSQSSSSSHHTTQESSNTNGQVSNNGENGHSSCANNCRTIVTTRQIVIPQTRSLPVPAPVADSHSWSEQEQRSHSSSRSISHTVNGVETNGLGKPYESEEEANYRREASGGSGQDRQEEEQVVHHQDDSETRALSSMSITRNAAAAAHEYRQRQEEEQQQRQEEQQHRTAAPTLSVGNYDEGLRRRRRFNCSQVISTTNLAEGAQTAAQLLATPAPCLVRRQGASSSGSSSSNSHQQSSSSQLETRSSSDNAMVYPPLQTIGRGDDEVHARVLSSSDDNHEEEQQQRGTRQEASYTTGGKTRRGYYRRTVFKNYTTAEFPSTFETWLGSN